MKSVLIVGAGRLGKGFVGETFFNANWEVAFLDNDIKVIEELNNKEEYIVRVHTTDNVFDNVISGYKAFFTDDNYSVMDSFLKSDLIMLPLYPKDFEEAAKYLAKCFEEQYKQNPKSKKTLICLTNKNKIINKITKYFRDSLESQETKEWFDANVVVRDSIVRRSTDADSNHSTNLITTAVASLLIQEPINVDFGDVKWLELRDKIEILKDIKVFTINGPHAATAYFGAYKGYVDIPSASDDPEIAELIKKIHDVTVDAVLYEFPVTREEIRELEYLPNAKDEMVDSIYRVGFDPVRKVGEGDRFMGVVKLCEKYDFDYSPISKALALAFLYDESKDENSQIIQDELKSGDVKKIVAKYIGRDETDEIVNQVADYYEKLKNKDKSYAN